MILRSEDVLFAGKGTGVVPWYRTGMPALHLGCDWVGFDNAPPDLRAVTSIKRGGHGHVNLSDYKIVVLQQPKGRMWFREIKRLQKLGIKVIYEVDDYLHGVRKVKGHRSAKKFNAKAMPDFELCMRACDAMIVSTPWLAKAYSRFNERIYVCRNSIEGKRYAQYELPERQSINIGWAGGEGHQQSVKAWLPAIERILNDYPRARFLSMGLPVADLLKRPTQAASLPFISIENFAPALTNFDIAIAPAGRGDFFKAKSDLRFLETGGLGIPLVADPMVYGEIIDSETGFYASDADQAEKALRALLDDAELRAHIGREARQYVLSHRSIEKGVEQWEKVFPMVWDAS